MISTALEASSRHAVAQSASASPRPRMNLLSMGEGHE